MSHSLYPLKFVPRLKEKIWGGQRLKDLFGKDFGTLSNCGESWELSGVPGNYSVISNGFLAGNELPELIEVYMGDMVGEKVFGSFGPEFPLLIKFLDTSDDLSIQVHPGDSLARTRHQSRGKAEMWYIVHADPGAELIMGFRHDTTPETYLQHLNNKSLKDILHLEKVKAGDVFYIPPGQVHAIGKGITLCEIQQSSDITYRIFDWDRPGDDGKPRKLHTREAMEAIDFRARDNKAKYVTSKNAPVELVQSPYFTTRLICFDRQLEQDYMFVDSFVVYVCLEGEFSLQYPDGAEQIRAGDTLLLPAEINSVHMAPKGFCRVLETYIV